MLVLKETGKPEYLAKNLQEQGREPTTNSTQIWRRHRGSTPGHIGGRRVLSPLRHPSLSGKESKQAMSVYGSYSRSIRILKKHTKLVTHFEPQSFFSYFYSKEIEQGKPASSCKFTSGVAVTSDYVIYSTGVLLSVNSLRILQDICSYKGEFKECTRLLKQLTDRCLF